ncbi:hypothetical protein EVAR_36990_1 [Eumeta japonica]|uniref:Uncharacterized protein n=1 Tax=Eumeta variegata TaxID=151549 RepID=A0A4C1WYY2_EUMVA|nr:hypothetical protein EVAR_36990_1 [Eumeta japonica]
MDTRNAKGVTSAFSASWKGIEYLKEGIGSVEGKRREWATGNLTHWTKPKSGSCYFMSIFYGKRAQTATLRVVADDQRFYVTLLKVYGEKITAAIALNVATSEPFMAHRL